jgi:hypothetical protein
MIGSGRAGSAFGGSAFVAEEVQKGEIDDAVAQINGCANGNFFVPDLLEAENLLIEFSRRVEIADAKGKMAKTGGHGYFSYSMWRPLRSAEGVSAEKT